VTNKGECSKITVTLKKTQNSESEYFKLKRERVNVLLFITWFLAHLHLWSKGPQMKVLWGWYSMGVSN